MNTRVRDCAGVPPLKKTADLFGYVEAFPRTAEREVGGLKTDDCEKLM